MQTVGIDTLVGSFLGEYRVEQLLGRGELSTVYTAQHSGQGRKAMVIMFNPPKGMSAQEHQRFSASVAQEGTILVKLRHPNILPTYDFGDLSGHPYLITALVKGVSLSKQLKQQGRFTLQQTLGILKQIAAGLDYAHSSGVVHGLLSTANILINQESSVQIINFGMGRVLGAHRHMQNEQSVDAYSDIYGLGLILFELLNGTPPFEGASSPDIAARHLQRPVPSIHARYPDIPEVLDLVIDKTLIANPAKGYQHASDVVFAIEHALGTVKALSGANSASTRQLVQDLQITLPPTVNWFDETSIFTDKNEPVPPMATGYMPTVAAPFSMTLSNTLPAMQPSKEERPFGAASNADTGNGADPLGLWSVTEARPDVRSPMAGTFTRHPAMSPRGPAPYGRRKTEQKSRRKVIALIAAGTVAAGIFTVTGINLLSPKQQSPAQIANVPVAPNGANPTTAATNKSTQGNTPTTQPTNAAQSTATDSTTPTAQPTQGAQPQGTAPTPQPTAAPPQPTAAPPSHTGTVIGSTSQAANSAKSFTNPADGQAALLIYLPNGNFVAGESACTHQGVTVRYNPSTQKLDCPAHGAIFDPANGFSYVPGSFSRTLNSLATVTIRVNGDGTITTG